MTIAAKSEVCSVCGGTAIEATKEWSLLHPTIGIFRFPFTHFKCADCARVYTVPSQMSANQEAREKAIEANKKR